MSVKKNRRPTNPVMRKMDDAIDYLEMHNHPVNVESVADNAAGRLSARTLTQWIEMLLRPFARQRLIARGYLITDQDTSARGHWSEMGVDDFDQQIEVKASNELHIHRHLKADKAVRKYLDTQRTALGREVTAGEFEEKVASIYAAHGITV